MTRLLALITALTLGTALAHAGVTAVVPARGVTVAAPKAVTLTFSEPLSLRFSTFKVVPVPDGEDPARLAATALARRDDVTGRADTAAPLTGTAARVTLPLKAGLNPGTYLIAWRLASEDGHPVVGHSTFRVR